MTERSYYETMSIIQYILEGHTREDASKEFDIRPQSVEKKLNLFGFTYADIVETRENRKSKKTKG